MEGRTMNRRRVFTALVVGSLTLGLLMSTGGVAFGAIKATVKAVDGNKFNPKHKYISKGDSFRWKNTDNVTHNVKAIDKKKNWNFFVSLSPGETSPLRKFGKTGNYMYRCTLHSTSGSCPQNGMCGIVHVSA
jgi:plastocyanin